MCKELEEKEVHYFEGYVTHGIVRTAEPSLIFNKGQLSRDQRPVLFLQITWSVLDIHALSNFMLLYPMLSGPFDDIQWWSYLSVLDRYSNLLTDYGSGSTLAMCPWVSSIDLIHELLFLISSWGSYHDIWSCFAVVTEDGDPMYRYPFMFTDFIDVGWTSLEDHLSARVILIYSLASASKITTLELSMKLLYWIYKISIYLYEKHASQRK